MGMSEFKLHAPYKAQGDQPQAIDALVRGLQAGDHHQVLLGVTGSGKTFTTVSYTHLDVYKRQSTGSATATISTSSMCEKASMCEPCRPPHPIRPTRIFFIEKSPSS